MITDAVTGFNNEDYIEAISSLVQELVFATKSLNNKYVFFVLSSEQSVKLLMSNHKTINIKGHELRIRPVAYSRIQLCDVPDAIDNKDIERELVKLNVPLLFKIATQLGSSDRLIYIHPSNNDLIRMSLNISNKHDNFQIVVRRHTICSLCHDTKHIALDCLIATDGQSTARSSNQRTDCNVALAKSAKVNNTNAPDKVVAGNSNDEEPHRETKACNKTLHKSEDRKSKDYSIPLLPMKSEINNNSLYPLNYEKFVSFLNETHGQPKRALTIALNYTKDIPGLMYMMKSIRKTKDRNTNAYLFRLIDALEIQVAQLKINRPNRQKP